MSSLLISPAAERDIEDILAWTQKHFGAQARGRYEALVVRAILDVAEQPERPGSRVHPEISPFTWTYQLRNSRERAGGPLGNVKLPRHFLVYRARRDRAVEIARVLHDSMDVGRHLPFALE